MKWRVEIDRAACRGAGACMEAAPDVFLVIERAGEHAHTSLLVETLPEEQRAAAEAAVLRCPNRALRIIETP